MAKGVLERSSEEREILRERRGRKVVTVLLVIALIFTIVKLILEHIKYLSIIHWINFKGIKEPTEIEMSYVSTQVAKTISGDIIKKLKL